MAAPTFDACTFTGGSYNNEFNSTASDGGLCTWDSANKRVTCDLTTVCGTTTDDNVLVAVRNQATGADNDFSVAAWCADTSGGGTSGADYCVVVTEGTTPEVEYLKLQGTPERDKLSFQMSTGKQLQALTGGPMLVGEQYGGADRDLLVGSNRISGSTYEDRLYGEAGEDRLFGLGGADSLDGGADADYIDGGLQSDTIHAGSGGDVVGGDLGGDTIHGDDGHDYLCGDALATVPTSSGGTVLIDNFAWVPPGNAWDPLVWDVTCGSSSGGDDTIWGGSGDDYLFGGKGGDNLDGGPGVDLAEGHDDNDELCDPSATGDWLDGGNGQDNLYATGNGLAGTLDGGPDDDGCTDEIGLTRLNCESVVLDVCPF